MKTLNLEQGSPEWRAHRAVSHNASDYPIIRGNSPFKTREEFVRERATGTLPEVGTFQQKIFDAGHAAEEGARAWCAEHLWCVATPCVGTTDDEYLSASFDGVDDLEMKFVEIKTANDTLRAVQTDDDIPDYIIDQMAQCFEVCGFDAAYLIIADNGSYRDVGVSCDYWRIMEARTRMRATWEQFDRDVANYVPDALSAKAVPVVGTLQLPVISVGGGAVAIKHNLEALKTSALAFIEAVPKAPATDQDFADVGAAAKALKAAEDALAKEEEKALAGFNSIAAMRVYVAEVTAIMRAARLTFEKQAKSGKDAIKASIVAEYQAMLDARAKAATDEIKAAHGPTLAVLRNKPTLGVVADFAGAMKGLSSLQSARDKCAQLLADETIKLQTRAKNLTANLAYFAPFAAQAELFGDSNIGFLYQHESFTEYLYKRIAAHDEAQRAAAAFAAQREREKAAIKDEAPQAPAPKATAPQANVDSKKAAARAALGLAFDDAVKEAGKILTMYEILLKAELWFADFRSEERKVKRG